MRTELIRTELMWVRIFLLNIKIFQIGTTKVVHEPDGPPCPSGLALKKGGIGHLVLTKKNGQTKHDPLING